MPYQLALDLTFWLVDPQFVIWLYRVKLDILLWEQLFDGIMSTTKKFRLTIAPIDKCNTASINLTTLEYLLENGIAILPFLRQWTQSITDHVTHVWSKDFQATVAPLSIKTYPLVDFKSFVSKSGPHQCTLLVLPDIWCSSTSILQIV